MPKMMSQFYCLKEEIVDLCNTTRDKLSSFQYFLCENPYDLFDFDHYQKCRGFDKILFSRHAITSDDKVDDYYFLHDNFILFNLGDCSVSGVQESSFYFSGANEALVGDAKIISRALKKITKAGVFIKNPISGAEQFYKDLRYSEGAAQMSRQGTPLLPIAGHCIGRVPE